MIEREALMAALNGLEKAIYDLSNETAGALVGTGVSSDHASTLMRIVGRQMRDLYRKLEENNLSRVTAAEVSLWIEQAVKYVHRWFGAPGDWGYETRIGMLLRTIYGS